jgi:hypothetical protein
MNLGLNNNFKLRDQGTSNARSIGDLPRHRWYFVKEGFSPSLVQHAIECVGIKGDALLFDPFSGSGTTLVTGANLGFRTRGFEVNPFLGFLSKTKLSHGDPKSFLLCSKKIRTGLNTPQPSPLEGYSTFSEGNAWNRWLFPTSVLRSFEGGLSALASIPGNARKLLKLALLGAAMDCCNAIPDGKCLRYKPDWLLNQANPEELAQAFERRVEAMSDDLNSNPFTNVDSTILQGDARQLFKRDEMDRFSLCVTSPPYLNSFDYSDVYRPELFLGRFVESNKTLMKVRLKTVRSHVQASWTPPKKDDFGAIYKDCIFKIREVSCDHWDKRLPKMIQAYFEDMELILSGLKKHAADEAKIWIIVSTSAYAGIQIPVDLILAEMGQRVGLFLEEVGVLRYLRSSSQHVKHVEEESRKSVPLRESVVIFSTTKSTRPPRR